MKAYLLLDMAKENKKEWRDITNNYSEKRRHYNGEYLEKSLLLDEETKIQLYKVIEDGFDYDYEIFVNHEKFYGSTYPDNPYEAFEQMKEDLYKESFKKNKYSKKFINEFTTKYHIWISSDCFFSGFEKMLEAFSRFDEIHDPNDFLDPDEIDDDLPF